MTPQDRNEFKLYLRNCTDAQVKGVYDKEQAAGREDYRELARDEAERRGLDWAHDDLCPECGAREGSPAWGTVGDGFDGYCPSCADAREGGEQ